MEKYLSIRGRTDKKKFNNGKDKVQVVIEAALSLDVKDKFYKYCRGNNHDISECYKL